MTDEVATLVLRNNYQQSQSVSVSEAMAGEEHDRLERLMRSLERGTGTGGGRLDRAVEFLPNTAAMRARALAKQYLTRPELCVLHRAKLDLSDEIRSDCRRSAVRASFCAISRRAAGGYEPAIAPIACAASRHPQVVNSLVNRCGPTFVRSVGARTGAPAAAIARAFAVARDAWKLRDLWGDIEALDPALKAEAQIRMLVASQRFLARVVQWTLRRLPQPLDAMAATEQLGAAVAALGDLPSSLIGAAESAALAERAAGFEAMGAPAGVARRAASLETLAAAGDLMRRRGQRLQHHPRRGSIPPGDGRRSPLATAPDVPRDGQWSAQAAPAPQDELAPCADLLASARAPRPEGMRRSRAGALERTAQACPRSGRPADEGRTGDRRRARPRHAVGRYGRVANFV
jgi:glutamate dehydrogenase